MTGGGALALFLLAWGVAGVFAGWPLCVASLGASAVSVAAAYLVTRILYAASGLLGLRGSAWHPRLAALASAADLVLVSSLSSWAARGCLHGVAADAAVALVVLVLVARCLGEPTHEA